LVGASNLLLLAASPIFFTEFDEVNPKSESVLFMASRAIKALTEKVLENEPGQSLMMVLIVGSMAYIALHQGFTSATARKLKVGLATRFGSVGHPYYTEKLFASSNPLLRGRVMQEQQARKKKH